MGSKRWTWVLLCLALIIPAGTWAAEAQKAKTVSALEAYEILQQGDKNTFLVDVRCRWEYFLMGHPPQAYNIPWRLATIDFQVKGGPFQRAKAPYTGYQLSVQPNPDFAGVANSLFKPDDRLVVICTDGKLGAEAADALVESGFKKVYHVEHGFLGEPLESKEHGKLAEMFSPSFGQRGKVNGWVYWGLPVKFTIDPRYVYPPDLKRMQSMK